MEARDRGCLFVACWATRYLPGTQRAEAAAEFKRIEHIQEKHQEHGFLH